MVFACISVGNLTLFLHTVFPGSVGTFASAFWKMSNLGLLRLTPLLALHRCHPDGDANAGVSPSACPQSQPTPRCNRHGRRQPHHRQHSPRGPSDAASAASSATSPLQTSANSSSHIAIAAAALRLLLRPAVPAAPVCRPAPPAATTALAFHPLLRPGPPAATVPCLCGDPIRRQHRPLRPVHPTAIVSRPRSPARLGVRRSPRRWRSSHRAVSFAAATRPPHFSSAADHASLQRLRRHPVTTSARSPA